MVQFNGKYQLTSDENFLEFIKQSGAPDPAKIASSYSLITVTKEGNKFTLVDISGTPPLTKVFVVGETIEEELVKDLKTKTTTTLDGNKLTLEAVESRLHQDASTLKRTYEFSDDGLNITYISSKLDVQSKRYFKRV